MTRLHFATEINASPEKIWKILWEDATYRNWTSIFCEGSYAISDWQEGSTVHFLTPSGDGMYSNIARMIPNEDMSFKHQGYLKDGKEVPVDPAVEAWVGAEENYTLKAHDGKVLLSVALDSTEKEAASFEISFPKALQKVKELAEQS